MNFYKHNLGAYAKHTGDLDALQHGIYRLLLDFYYGTEKPLPNDPTKLKRIARAHARNGLQATMDIVQRFFKLEPDGCWHNPRCDAELANYKRRSDIASGNIKTRWDKEKSREINTPNIRMVYGPYTDGNTIQNPDSRVQNTEEEKIRTKKKKKDTPAAVAARESLNGLSEPFNEFWKAYPRHVSKTDAMKAFAKIHPDETLLKTMLEAIARQRGSNDWLKDAGQFIPHPATWLNKKRWDDEVLPTAKGKHGGFEVTDYHAGVRSDGSF